MKQLITFLIFLQSCASLPEPGKESEIVYYNKSVDTITKIEIKLIQDRTKAITDIIILNKEIQSGDSLVFKYNTENFINTPRTTEFFTTVYFKKQNPILNKVYKKGYVSGYFAYLNNIIFQVYIGNTNIVPCARNKPVFPNVDLKNTKCELDSLD